MKKLLLTAILAAGVSAGAFAQGTVQFQNFSSATALVYTNNGSGNVAITTPFTAELLYGTVGTAIGSLNSAVIFTVNSPTSGKFFDGATIALSGITAGNGTADATQNVTLAVRGWTGNFASYALAVAGGAYVGETTTFTNPTGGNGTATPANLIGWTSANNLVLTVPEPSTIALGGLGAAALLLFRRRK